MSSDRKTQGARSIMSRPTREPFAPAKDLDPNSRVAAELAAASAPAVDAESDASGDEDSERDAPATLVNLRAEFRAGLRLVAGELAGVKGEVGGVKTAVDGVKAAIEGLGTRVVTLEADAAWKLWAIRIVRAVVPFVGGVLVQKYPELKAYLPAVLQAAGGAP